MSTFLKRTSEGVLQVVERFCEYHDLFHKYPRMDNILDTGTFVHGPYDVFPQEFIEKEFKPVGRSYGTEDGYVPLRQAIVEFENKIHDTGYTTENVAIMPGAWAGLEFAIEEIMQLEGGKISQQGKIAVIGPTLYQMFHRPIWVYGMDARGYDFVLPGQSHVPETMEDLEEIFQAHPRLIIISNPNNPDGVYFPVHLLKEVIERASGEGIYILLDEIQNCFLGGETGLGYGGWINAPVVRVDSPAKRYGLAAYRVGWIIASPSILGDRRSGIVGRASSMMGNAPKALDRVLVSILEQERTNPLFLQSLKNELQKKEAYIIDRLKNMGKVVEVYPREGCVNLAFKVDYAKKDDLQLAEDIMKEGALMMPASGYGYNPEDNVLRITFTEPLQTLERGLDALERVLNA